MADEGKDSKTEDPTEKKVSDALDKGDVPFSKEVTYVVTTLAITTIAIVYAPSFATEMTKVLRTVFARSLDWSLNSGEDAMDVAVFLVRAVGICLLPIIVPLMFFGLLSSLTQNTPRMVLDRIQPKIERVSLAKGLKRLLGWHSLKEFLKSLFKFSAAGTISVVAAVYNMDWVLSHLLIDALHIPFTVHKIFVQVAFGLVLLISILGLVDFIWTRREWFNKLKMTHQEVKDERKQSEGDPIVKMRSQSLARDRARNKMISRVSEATLVIANPTHFSIALRYRPETDAAPYVLAGGQDLIALKIRALAEESDIPIIEDKPLARSMYKVCKIDQEIPIEFYVPIARIVRILSEKEQKLSS